MAWSLTGLPSMTDALQLRSMVGRGLAELDALLVVHGVK